MTDAGVSDQTRARRISRARKVFDWIRRAFWSLLPLAIGLYIASGLDKSGVVDRLQNAVFDQYQRWHPREYTPQSPVRVVIVDNESLARFGQWPWPHDTYSKLITRLAAAGAASIGFDVVFADKDRLANTAILDRLPDLPEREALKQAMHNKGQMDEGALQRSVAAAPVVLGYVLARTGSSNSVPVKWGMATNGDDPKPFLTPFPKAILPLPNLVAASPGLGSFNMAPDQDLLVRRIPLFVRIGEGDEATILPTLGAETLRIAQRASTYLIKSSNSSGAAAFGEKTGVVSVRIGGVTIPTGGDSTVRVHFSGTQEARHIPAWKVLEGSFDPKQIEGRIILVGVSASALADFRATPLEQSVPGVDAHAEMIEQVLQGVQLVRPDYAPGLEFLLLLLGAILLVVMIQKTRALAASLTTLMLVGAAGLGSWLAFRHAGFLFDPLIPGVTWLATASIGLVSAYRKTEREKQFVRNAFSRYLSPAVVERIAADPSQLSLGGETRNVTILFSDVRDFTSRSEKLDAEGVVRFLNSLHTPFTGAILTERGTIDKYIGDGLMAFWNAPLPVPDHANRACGAALAMLASVPSIDATVAVDAGKRGVTHEPVRIGIGINTGDVFVGNMGSEQRFDYSIVGDPVNVAARLESATKEFACPIVVSQSTRDAADEFVFVELGAAGLKGKTGETSIFALHGYKKQAGPKFEEFVILHHDVIIAAAARDANLTELVTKARAHPQSTPYHLFYDRLLRIGQTGP